MSEVKNYEELINNEEFKEKLDNAETEADVIDAFASVGIEASAGDLRELAAAIQAESLKDSGDLSEEQLEAVSGGVVDWILAIKVGYKIGKAAGNAIYKYGKKKGWFF